jgi:hypothetical protein
VTLREGLNLLSVATLASDVGSPTDALVTELQRERRLSLVFLAGGVQERSALATQRRRTDDTRKVFNSKVASGNTPGGALGERIGDTL